MQAGETEGVSMPRLEGFRAYYDKIVPESYSKIGRQFGLKVGESNIKTDLSGNVGYHVVGNDKEGLDIYGVKNGQNNGAPVVRLNPGEGQAAKAEAMTSRLNATVKEGQPVHSVDIAPMRAEISKQ